MSRSIQAKRQTSRGRSSGEIFAQVVRTFGFILLTAGTIIFTVFSVVNLIDKLGSTAEEYAQYVTKVNDWLRNLGVPNIGFYGAALMLVGLLFIILAIGRSWVGKIIHVIAFLLLTSFLLFRPGNVILFSRIIKTVPEYITTFSNNYIGYFNLLDPPEAAYPKLIGGIVLLVYVIVASSVLGNKKPKRLSLSFVKAGLGFLMAIILIDGILMPIAAGMLDFVEELITSKVYLIIVYGFLFFGLAFQLLGSVIGTIFFFIK